jgi:hypothetical protein
MIGGQREVGCLEWHLEFANIQSGPRHVAKLGSMLCGW